jgi:hypothetical protein
MGTLIGLRISGLAAQQAAHNRRHPGGHVLLHPILCAVFFITRLFLHVLALYGEGKHGTLEAE